MNVLITRKINASAVQLLIEAGFEVDSFDVNRPLDPKYLADNIHKYDAILTCVSEKIDTTILDKAVPRLKIISNMAVGLDNIDVEYARSLGIKVFNTPSVVTNPTADITLAMGFALLRKVKEADLFVRGGLWHAWDPEIFLGRNFSSITWGIVGYGNIGKAVARRLSGFDCRIIYYDPLVTAADGIGLRVEIDYLLKNADVISLHLPLHDSTRNFINLEKLRLMKSNAILINMARGGIVNTHELLLTLRQKGIAGAALDVFDPEPVPFGHEILNMENVLFTPHIGTATIECRIEMAEFAARNIIQNI